MDGANFIKVSTFNKISPFLNKNNKLKIQQINWGQIW
jgi:hypothetical protein